MTAGRLAGPGTRPTEGAKTEPAKSKTAKAKARAGQEERAAPRGRFRIRWPVQGGAARRTWSWLAREPMQTWCVPRPRPPPARRSRPRSPRGEASNATVDRLPLGKQSVAVTVDVQAPASMNLNQEATLKLIVRNTGASDALNVGIEDELPEGLRLHLERARDDERPRNRI